MYVYYIYTYIIELCQHVFIYNEKAQCTSHTSCAKVLELAINLEGTLFSMIKYVLFRKILASERFEHFVCRGCIYKADKDSCQLSFEEF